MPSHKAKSSLRQRFATSVRRRAAQDSLQAGAARRVRQPRNLAWTDLDRAHEWIEGLTRITDVTGPVATAGTRYTAWFGRMRSPERDPPGRPADTGEDAFR